MAAVLHRLRFLIASAFLVCTLLCQAAFAENYSERPDILSLTPTKHAELGKTWEALKEAHLEAVAMLAEIYPNPNQEIYFLARDSEYLYDMMKIMAQDDPALLKRIHLLNISRTNMRSTHVKDYLHQEGITEEALKAGKKIVFVDTGFSGTIPQTISEYYPKELESQMQTHLMSSANPSHPSSRVFLTKLNPEAPNLDPGSMHGTILSYEHMPRFTERSSHFEKVNGKWEPISDPGKYSDGKVSRLDSKEFMEDLYQYSNDSKKLFNQRRGEWKKLYTFEQGKNTAALKHELELLAKSEKPIDQAMARDFIELLSKNLNSEAKISVEDLGLKPITISDNSVSNKMYLIKKHPKWKTILQDPSTQIPKLIKENDLLKLGAIADAIDDFEFKAILCTELGNHADKNEVKNFIQSLVKKKSNSYQMSLAQFTFSNPKTVNLKNLIKSMIEDGDQIVLWRLAIHTFNKPHAAEMKDLIKLLIEKGNLSVLNSLIMGTFTKLHAEKMTDILELVIKKADQNVLDTLLYTFTMHHNSDTEKLILQIIEKANQQTLFALSLDYFQLPHFKKMKKLLRELIERGNNHVLTNLSINLSTKSMQTPDYDVFRKAIEIEDQQKRIAFLEQHLGPKTHCLPISNILEKAIVKAEEKAHTSP